MLNASSTRSTTTAFVLCLCLPIFPSAAEPPAPLFRVATHSEFPLAAETFEEVRQLILNKYYAQSIDEPSLYYAAILGMLRHISPPRAKNLAKLWSAAEYEKFTDALKGVRATIGIRSTFDQGDGSLTVNEVLAGSPAEELLQQYDRIVRIDGEPLKSKALVDVDRMLNGDDGTSVQLTVVRDIQVLEIGLRRNAFKVDNLVGGTLPEQVGYFKVRKVTLDVSKALHEQLKTYVAKGITKVIIDLRNNPGGVFAEGMKMAELFLPQQSVLLRTLRRGEEPKTFVSSNLEPHELELVLLVNAKTASASEIFVGALKAHNAATIVGTSTFGKATMEETFKLDSDYRVKFIVGTLYEPRGASWYGSGIKPDFDVQLDSDLYEKLDRISLQQRLHRDPQLFAAWKVLQ